MTREKRAEIACELRNSTLQRMMLAAVVLCVLFTVASGLIVHDAVSESDTLRSEVRALQCKVAGLEQSSTEEPTE